MTPSPLQVAKKQLAVTIGLLSSLMLTSFAQTYPEPGVFPPAGSGWQKLYDGSNFSDWEENGLGWKEEAGEILSHNGLDGGQSHLFYMGENNNWRDFEFIAEVRTTFETNSGIIFHSHWFENNEDNDQGWDPFGNEAQINNTKEDEDMKTGSLYTSVVIGESPVNDDEWWTHYVRVEGQHVVIRVNDVKTVDWISDPSGYRDLSEGTFALQGHDKEPRKVEFRNIYARRLTSIDEGLWVDAGDHGIALTNTPINLTPAVHQDGVPTTTFTTTWELITRPDGATATFGDINAPTTTATFSHDGNYTLKITVENGQERYADSVKYQVGNRAPVISGERYREVATETDEMIDDLVVTDDGLPNNSLTYQWQVDHAAGAYTISDTAKLSPTFQFTAPGDYHFNLTVSDGLATSLHRFIFAARPLKEIPEGCSVSGSSIGVFRLDNHLLDTSGSDAVLQLEGNAAFATDNLSWMASPLGAAVRVQGPGDQLTVSFPDSLIDARAPESYSLSARLYINQFIENPGSNINVLSLWQDWNSGITFAQSAWDDVPEFRFGNGQLISRPDVGNALPTGTWLNIVVNVHAEGLTELYVNDVLIGSFPVTLNPQGRDYVLTVGNFDGWIDDLCVHNTAPTVDAGNDQSIIINNAALLAIASDDDFPGQGENYSWAVLEEPSLGAATITNPGSPSTAVTLTQLGDYTFQIAASDGALFTTDTVLIRYLDGVSDTDGDGWPNVVEAYLGTDLSGPDDPIQSVSIATDGSTTIQYERAATPPTGVTGHFEWSADMASWQLSGAADPSGRSVTINEQVVSDPGTDPELVEATFTASDEARVFVRLRAQQ